MSMSERTDVLDEHKYLVEKGNRKHQALEATLAAIRRAGKRSGGASATMESQLARRTISAVTFFWNYNTVESVLLFCAVLVNLAGVMFESGQLDQRGFEAQKAFITWVVVLIIVLSIAYFFVVLISEIYLMCTANSKRNQEKAAAAAKKQSEINRRKLAALGNEPVAAAESAALNPLFAVSSLGADGSLSDGTSLEALLDLPNVPTLGQWNAIVVGSKNLLQANRQLAEDLAKAKQENQKSSVIPSRSLTGGAAAAAFGSKPSASSRQLRAGVTVKRRQFVQTSSAQVGTPSEDGLYTMESPLFHSPV
jgi:hypothetical protein